MPLDLRRISPAAVLLAALLFANGAAPLATAEPGVAGATAEESTSEDSTSEDSAAENEGSTSENEDSAVKNAAEAGSEEVVPPPLTHYKGREIAVTMHYEGAPWLTRESRQREEDCKTLLKALHLKPGQDVCDLGCGNGFYTLSMARLVGKRGTVYAVDIQPEMLHLLSERAKSAKIGNLKLVLGTTVDPKLPEHALDLVLLVDVYHELSNPEEMLKNVRKSLRPHGRLVLAEFRLEDPEVPIKLLHKMSKEQILKEIPPAGFRLVEEFDDLPWQHLMFFEPAEEGPTAQPDVK